MEDLLCIKTMKGRIKLSEARQIKPEYMQM
jgi:hypothetical protein